MSWQFLCHASSDVVAVLSDVFDFSIVFSLDILKCLGSDPSRFALTRGASSSSDRRPTTSDQHLRPSLDIFLISLQVEKDGASQLKGTAFPWFGNTHKITALGTEPVQYAFVSNLKKCCWIDRNWWSVCVSFFCFVRSWYSWFWPGKDTSGLWCFALPTRLIQMICPGWIRCKNTKHAPCLEPLATSSHAWDMLAHCLQEFGLFLLDTPLVPIGFRHLQSYSGYSMFLATPELGFQLGQLLPSGLCPARILWLPFLPCWLYSGHFWTCFIAFRGGVIQ